MENIIKEYSEIAAERLENTSYYSSLGDSHSGYEKMIIWNEHGETVTIQAAHRYECADGTKGISGNSHTIANILQYYPSWVKFEIFDFDKCSIQRQEQTDNVFIITVFRPSDYTERMKKIRRQIEDKLRKSGPDTISATAVLLNIKF